MIIYENGTYQTNTVFPDTLYDENAKWCIPDDNELAFKYSSYANQGLTPKLIFNEDNKIIDVDYDDSQLKKQEIIIHIDMLKQQLADGDYKIIKCYEADLTKTEMPYDINELITIRNSIREEINNLEESLKEQQ